MTHAHNFPPPPPEATTNPDLGENHEGESIRLLKAKTAHKIAKSRRKVSGSKARKMLREMDANVTAAVLDEVHSGVVQMRSRPRACDVTKQWPVTS